MPSSDSSPRFDEEDMHNYQWDAVVFLLETLKAGLFIDTGLGKTVIALTLIRILLQMKPDDKILVVGPITVVSETWPTEIASWAHLRHIEHAVIRAEDDDEEVIAAGKAARAKAAHVRRSQMIYDTLILLGDDHKSAKQSKDRYLNRVEGKAKTDAKETMRRRLAESPEPLHLIDREHLLWLVDYHSEWIIRKRNGVPKRVRKVVSWPYKCVIIDESSCMKDHSTNRFKAMNAAVNGTGNFVERMIEMTATPAAETYLHLFPQIYLLDKGARLGKNITAYKKAHFDEDKYTRTIKLKPGHDRLISEAISDIVTEMKSKTYLNEQEPLWLSRPIHFRPAEQEVYDSLERDFVADLPVINDDGEEGIEIIEAETAAALSAKLLQLASGAIYDAQGKTRFFHDHKIDDLKQLREELKPGEPILVAYWWKSSLQRLKKAFPDAVEMSKKGKEVALWNAGKIPMLLMHPASNAHGLNLQYGPGHDVYFFDIHWSWELVYQFFRRLHRQGQKLQVRIHVPQMKGTRDEMVAERLANKEDAQETLFRWIRETRKRMRERRELKKAA